MKAKDVTEWRSMKAKDVTEWRSMKAKDVTEWRYTTGRGECDGTKIYCSSILRKMHSSFW